MYVSCECCILSGRGLSDGLIPCPEESCGLTVIECGQVQQLPATLTLVEEVRLSKKEPVYHCHHSLMLPPLLIFSLQVVQVC
jgi:hypothetical protein